MAFWLLAATAFVKLGSAYLTRGGGGDGTGRHVYGRGAAFRTPGPNGPDLSGARYYAAFDDAIKDFSGGATYTLSAGDDIVYPPAIANYLLSEIGGLTSSTYVKGGLTTFGSFDTAMTDLDALSNQWEIIARYTQQIDVESAIRGLMSQCPITFWRSQLDNFYKAQVYKQTPASQDYFTDLTGANYKWSYSEDMIEGSVLTANTPSSEIVNEVHVKFGMYAPSGEYTGDAWVGPSGSDDGTGTADEAAAGEREAQAAASQTQFSIKNTLTIHADQIYTAAQAVVLRNSVFDRKQRPRVLLQFDTWGRATTMDLHMNTLVNDEIQDFIPVPKYPHGATQITWDDLIFYVRSKRIFNDNGRIRHRILLEEVPQPL